MQVTTMARLPSMIDHVIGLAESSKLARLCIVRSRIIWTTVIKIPRPNNPSRTIFFRVWIWVLSRTGKGRNILRALCQTMYTAAPALELWEKQGARAYMTMSKTIVRIEKLM